MSTESDWSLVKVEGQLATLSLDVVKEGFRFGKKLKRAADVARARLSLKRTVEQMTIDDGWAPVIVSPEYMPIRCLVDIFRKGNLAEVQATVLRHIVTHHSAELFCNVGKQKINPIAGLKMLGDLQGDVSIQKMESLCQEGPFIRTTISPKPNDMPIFYPISMKICMLKYLNSSLERRAAHITLSESFASYLRKDGSRSTDEQVAEYVSSRLNLFPEISSAVATGTESDRDFVNLLHKGPAVSIQGTLFLSGAPFTEGVFAEICEEDPLTPACYESLCSSLKRLLVHSEWRVLGVGYPIGEAVLNVILGVWSHVEATIDHIHAVGTFKKRYPPERHLTIRISDGPCTASRPPSGVLDALIQSLLSIRSEHLRRYCQSVLWSGENSLIEVFVEHVQFAGKWCKLEIGGGKISILRGFPDLSKLRALQNEVSLLQEAVLQLEGISVGLNLCASLLKLGTLRYLNDRSPYTFAHASPSSSSVMMCLNGVFAVLSRTWKACIDEVHNYEPSLENMMSARKYRGLDADILKGFELTVIDWNKIAIAGRESTSDVRDNMITPEATKQIFQGEIRLDELYIDTILSLIDDKDFKFIRHEEKCVDALWVSNYYGLEQEEALFPELHKACSVFFDTIDNYYVSVPTLKKLLVIYKDPGTDINLKESLFKQKTGSAAGEKSRLVFLELASAIRPSSSDPSKVSISEAIRRRNIADAVEGIIFKYGKVEEKIRENLHRDVSLWKRSRLKKSDIMRKVEETTRGILAKEDLAWLERELVATWGKMGMVKVPQLCSEESSEHDQYYQFANSHGSDKQRIMHYITMDTPVPVAGVVVTEDSNDGEALVCVGGVDLEKTSSYLGAPLYRMKDGKSRRRKRKSQHAKIWEDGYIE